MPPRKPSGKMSDASRPHYGGANDELKKLEDALTSIRGKNTDVNGKSLTDLQRSQIDLAIKEIHAAKTLLVCIQDQAPYSFEP
jgi:hypothetical protein